MSYHQQLTESIEDQLSLASIHYQRAHFQEATDIYKRLLLENREFLALNVWVQAGGGAGLRQVLVGMWCVCGCGCLCV